MLKVKPEKRIFLTNLIYSFQFFLFFSISLSFTCVAAIGNLSEQAGFALKKRFGLSLKRVESISFLGKQKKSFHKKNKVSDSELH
jgi:hypothetical protein